MWQEENHGRIDQQEHCGKFIHGLVGSYSKSVLDD